MITQIRGRRCDRLCNGGCGQSPCQGSGCNSCDGCGGGMYGPEPTMQDQQYPQQYPQEMPVDGGYESAPVEGNLSPQVDPNQGSPLDGSARNPIVDPSAFIIRGNKRIANTN